MKSLFKAFLLLGLLAALAASSPTQIQKRSFKVDRVKNLNFKGHNGPRLLLKAYRKFRMPVPQDLIDAVNAQGAAAAAEALGADKEVSSHKKGHQAQATSAAAANTVSPTSAPANTAASAGTGLVVNNPAPMDLEYLSPVSIGGQTLVMDFDSGSSDLWVFNTQLRPQATTGHTLFDPTKSDTFQMLSGASFLVSYGDGSGAEGNVGTDTVNIGGATVTKQAIELATAISTTFVQDTMSNGLVGLAFSELNTVKPQKQKTFFDNVIPSLAEPLFTADLRPNATGAYEFGRIDTTKFTGQMTWIPVNTTQGFWQFSSTKFAVGTGATTTADANGQAIADTGTTLLLVNMKIATAYYSQVQGAANQQKLGGFTIPCDAQLPDLMLDVGGQYMAKIKGSDINFGAPVDQTNTVCFGGLQGTTSDLQIFGDVFFKSQFVAFNGGNNTLGMAEHV